MFFTFILFLSFIVLAVAAVRWGHDSRDNAHTMKWNPRKFHAVM
jgi:hypothetical protein